MTSTKLTQAILFIDKNKAAYYARGMSSVSTLNFSEEAVSHLEIVSIQKLEEIIGTFFDKKTIKPARIIIVLNKNTYFERDLTDVAKTHRAEEEKNFLDIVPFESIVSKVFRVQKKDILIVVNKDFCKELSRIITINHCVVEAIVPLSIVMTAQPRIGSKIDAVILLKKFDVIKQYGLFFGANSRKRNTSRRDSSERNIRFLVLLTLFGFLLGVLLVVVYSQSFRPIKKSKVIPSEPVPTVLINETATPSSIIIPQNTPRVSSGAGR